MIDDEFVTPQEMKKTEKQHKNKRLMMLVLIVALAVGRAGYSIVYLTGYEQTALLFIGIPFVIAWLITLAPPATSAKGIAFKTTFLILSLAGILLPEGLVCLVMSAPIMFIAVYLGAKLGYQQSSTKSRFLAAIPLMVLLTDAAVITRQQTVVVERVVPLSTVTITDHLADPWTWEQPLPAFTRLGFPVPVDSAGHGLNIGDTRTITFEQEGRLVTMQWQVTAVDDTHVRFTNIADETAIANWLEWATADIEWRPTATGETAVTWSVSYERQLDPALYFAPLQRVIMVQTLDYLLDAIIVNSVGGDA